MGMDAQHGGPSRRHVIAGAAASLLLPSQSSAVTAAEESLFKGTALEGNAVAAAFQTFRMPLPNVTMIGPAGPVSLMRVRGKARLVALWAEWCAPCLSEMSDLAVLRRETRNEQFDIGLLLTASLAKFDRAQALAKLRTRGASSMPYLVEPDGGSIAAQRLAGEFGKPSTKDFVLPCTILVDAKGIVRARMKGVHADPAIIETLKKRHIKDSKPDGSFTLTDEDKKTVAAGGTIWAGAEARDFARALAKGILDVTG